MNGTWRSGWAEFSPGFDGLRFVLRVSDDKYDRDSTLSICLGWGTIYIRIPYLYSEGKDPCQDSPHYGLYYYASCVWFCFGQRTKAWHMPWDYGICVRTSYLTES